MNVLGPSLLIGAAILLSPLKPAYAFVKQESFSVPPSKQLLDRVDKRYDKRARRNEELVMNEAFESYLKRAKPGIVFKAATYRKDPDTLENSDLSQSWRDEAALALDGKTVPKVVYLVGDEDLYRHFYQNSPIAAAKKIARAKMYEAIQKNWTRLKDTVFNDEDLECASAESCPGFDDVILGKKMPETFFYSYPLSNRSNKYVFEFTGVGFVEVDKNLKSGRVIFGISYLNDLNRPEKGSENLRTDVDAGLAPAKPPTPSKGDSPSDGSSDPSSL